jgi:hypothetical protein
VNDDEEGWMPVWIALAKMAAIGLSAGAVVLALGYVILRIKELL